MKLNLSTWISLTHGLTNIYISINVNSICCWKCSNHKPFVGSEMIVVTTIYWTWSFELKLFTGWSLKVTFVELLIKQINFALSSSARLLTQVLRRRDMKWFCSGIASILIDEVRISGDRLYHLLCNRISKINFRFYRFLKVEWTICSRLSSSNNACGSSNEKQPEECWQNKR